MVKNKRYRLNFTLADGSTKSVECDIPLGGVTGLAFDDGTYKNGDITLSQCFVSGSDFDLDVYGSYTTWADENGLIIRYYILNLQAGATTATKYVQLNDLGSNKSNKIKVTGYALGTATNLFTAITWYEDNTYSILARRDDNNVSAATVLIKITYSAENDGTTRNYISQYQDQSDALYSLCQTLSSRHLYIHHITFGTIYIQTRSATCNILSSIPTALNFAQLRSALLEQGMVPAICYNSAKSPNNCMGYAVASNLSKTTIGIVAASADATLEQNMDKWISSGIYTLSWTPDDTYFRINDNITQIY